jgi:pSer/pThr/pTyr-binding forkhead associated (FHA) protein
MLAQLIPLDGGRPIDINRDVTVVGRKRSLCDLTIEHASISKLQCLIIRTDGLLFIRDLGSTNGTKVNGQRVTRGALLPGDELAFAGVKFRIHLGPGEEPEQVHHDERTEMISVAASVFEKPLLPDGDSEAMSSDMASDSDVRMLSDDSVV